MFGCSNVFIKPVEVWSLKAIDFYVADRFQVPNQKLHLSAIPRGSLEECWLCLRHFDYGPSGKNGCGVEFKNKVFGRKGVFFL